MIPSLEQFMLLFGDDEKTIQSLISCDIIHPTRTCNKCGLTTYVKISRQTYRCNKKSCRNEVTVRTGTFFALSKLPISKIMLLGYLWLTQMPVSSAASMTGCSNHTVCDIYQYYRKLVSNHLEFEDVQIGGEGVIVEIDETKLARRKYERGQSDDEVWVVGGVEKSADRKVFLVPIESRNPATLANIIERHVLPGSIVQTNLWSNYSELSETTMKKEEPAISFPVCTKSPVKHLDAETLKRTWDGLKQNAARRNRTTERIEEHLWEFIWRSKHVDDAWDGLLFALKEEREEREEIERELKVTQELLQRAAAGVAGGGVVAGGGGGGDEDDEELDDEESTLTRMCPLMQNHHSLLSSAASITSSASSPTLRASGGMATGPTNPSGAEMQLRTPPPPPPMPMHAPPPSTSAPATSFTLPAPSPIAPPHPLAITFGHGRRHLSSLVTRQRHHHSHLLSPHNSNSQLPTSSPSSLTPANSSASSHSSESSTSSSQQTLRFEEQFKQVRQSMSMSIMEEPKALPGIKETVVKGRRFFEDNGPQRRAVKKTCYI